VNRRGRGGQLREEILAAASRLLVKSSGDTVTLRAIAREAGIAAPSIYPHFADRGAIIDTIVTRNVERLAETAGAAYASVPAGAARVRAVTWAYVRFAEEDPSGYRIIFERTTAHIVTDEQEDPEGLRAFQFLADAVAGAVECGESTSTDPERDAQALWAAGHGLITLVPATPDVPWRPTKELIDRVATALTGL
jgi:AcrR family transcriptional regulator